MTVSDHSLGIYFVHVLVIEALAAGWLGPRLDALSTNPILAIAGLTVLTLVVSTGVTMVLRRLPPSQDGAVDPSPDPTPAPAPECSSRCTR